MSQKIKTRKPSEMLSRRSNNKKELSLLGSTYTNKVEKIRTEFLVPFPNQPRKYFDDDSLKELSESIKQYGVRQPLTIVPSDENSDQYYIVSGERRWRASKLSGLERVPCILLDEVHDVDEIAIIENLYRQDLNPLELGESFINLLGKGITQEELAKKLSQSRTKITEYVQFSKKIFSSVKKRITENSIFQIKHLRNISKQVTAEKQNEIVDKILGLKKSNSTNKPIIKFNLKTGNVNVDLKAIRKLDPKIKAELKNSLKDILKEL